MRLSSYGTPLRGKQKEDEEEEEEEEADPLNKKSGKRRVKYRLIVHIQRISPIFPGFKQIFPPPLSQYPQFPDYLSVVKNDNKS